MSDVEPKDPGSRWGLNRTLSNRLSQYLKFCLVGGTGVGVDMLVLHMLAAPQCLDWNITLSKVIAAEAAIINNFTWNDLWTFRGLASGDGGWVQRWRRFVRFNLICLSGIVLSVVLLDVQVLLLHLNLYMSNLVAIGLVSLWNFVLNVRFNWTAPAIVVSDKRG